MRLAFKWNLTGVEIEAETTMNSMKCKICGQDQAVVRFQSDDPILQCGHLQAANEELLLIEETVYQAKQLIRQKQREGMTEDEAIAYLLEDPMAIPSKQLAQFPRLLIYVAIIKALKQVRGVIHGKES